MQVPAAPILVGLLFDFPQADGGESFEEAVRLGLDEIAATPVVSMPSSARASSKYRAYPAPTGEWSWITAALRTPRCARRRARIGGSSSSEPIW